MEPEVAEALNLAHTRYIASQITVRRPASMYRSKAANPDT